MIIIIYWNLFLCIWKFKTVHVRPSYAGSVYFYTLYQPSPPSPPFFPSPVTYNFDIIPLYFYQICFYKFLLYKKTVVKIWTTFFTSSWNLQHNELFLEFLGQIIKKWEAFNSFFKKMKNVFTNFSFFKNLCSRLDPIFHILVKFARQWAFFGVSRSNNKKMRGIYYFY